MSATPIPRTLQHTLLGIRDISRIETPPTTRNQLTRMLNSFLRKRVKQIIRKRNN